MEAGEDRGPREEEEAGNKQLSFSEVLHLLSRQAVLGPTIPRSVRTFVTQFLLMVIMLIVQIIRLLKTCKYHAVLPEPECQYID